MSAESSPTVSLAPDSLLGTPTPASKLYDFLLSSLTPRASTYSLPLTVLLKGSLGSGKRTLIRSVARRAGVGLLELDCFDLLGESDAKTEGRLRALAVDKALACAPVVLVLRNVEALARKSQAMETGQGEFARDVLSRFGGLPILLSSLLIRVFGQIAEPPMTTVLRDCFATIRDGWKASGHPVVVVATTTDVEKVPTGVLGLFKEEIGIQVRPVALNPLHQSLTLTFRRRPQQNPSDSLSCETSPPRTSSPPTFLSARSQSKPPRLSPTT